MAGTGCVRFVLGCGLYCWEQRSVEATVQTTDRRAARTLLRESLLKGAVTGADGVAWMDGQMRVSWL